MKNITNINGQRKLTEIEIDGVPHITINGKVEGAIPSYELHASQEEALRILENCSLYSINDTWNTLIEARKSAARWVLKLIKNNQPIPPEVPERIIRLCKIVSA